MTRRLDDIDWALLRSLSADGRRTVRALAREVGLSDPSVRDRILRLEREGIIAGYHAAVDPAAVGGTTAAFVALRFGSGERARQAVNHALRADPCVLEAHEVAGEDCYFLKLRVASTTALAEALDRLRAIPSVSSTATTIVLRTVFERSLMEAEGRPVAEPDDPVRSP